MMPRVERYILMYLGKGGIYSVGQVRYKGLDILQYSGSKERPVWGVTPILIHLPISLYSTEWNTGVWGGWDGWGVFVLFFSLSLPGAIAGNRKETAAIR